MIQTIFLDRDGVINEEKRGSYIFHPEEFTFYEGACEAIVTLSKRYKHLIIVTNQRGIGRGLMTEQQLDAIHLHLKKEVSKAGGRIDGIYFAPQTDNDHPMRKPNTGMALKAKKDFPDIDFEKSIMVGNNLSDMEFGKNLAMKTVFLSTTQDPLELPHPLIDYQFPSLSAWVQTLQNSGD